jgi:hypothetical protein
LRKDDELIFCTCHLDVDIVLIPDSRILDHCGRGHNALKANHNKSPDFCLCFLSQLFSDSSSDDTDLSDVADADDGELDSVLFSASLVRNPLLLGLFFKLISWVVLLFCFDVVTEVNPFLLCCERIHQRSLPREPLPEFDIVINFKKSLLIKIYL